MISPLAEPSLPRRSGALHGGHAHEHRHHGGARGSARLIGRRLSVRPERAPGCHGGRRRRDRRSDPRHPPTRSAPYLPLSRHALPLPRHRLATAACSHGPCRHSERIGPARARAHLPSSPSRATASAHGLLSYPQALPRGRARCSRLQIDLLSQADPDPSPLMMRRSAQEHLMGHGLVLAVVISRYAGPPRPPSPSWRSRCSWGSMRSASSSRRARGRAPSARRSRSRSTGEGRVERGEPVGILGAVLAVSARGRRAGVRRGPRDHRGHGGDRPPAGGPARRSRGPCSSTSR